jgi:hypothetical protein
MTHTLMSLFHNFKLFYAEDDMSSGMLCPVVSWKLTTISEVPTTVIIIILMMEAVSTSRTSVTSYKKKWYNIPVTFLLAAMRTSNLSILCHFLIKEAFHCHYASIVLMG